MAKQLMGPVHDHELVRRGGLSPRNLEEARFLAHYPYATAEFDPDELDRLIDSLASAIVRVGSGGLNDKMVHRPAHCLSAARIANEIDVRNLLETGVTIDQARSMEGDLQAAGSSADINPQEKFWLFR